MNAVSLSGFFPIAILYSSFLSSSLPLFIPSLEKEVQSQCILIEREFDMYHFKFIIFIVVIIIIIVIHHLYNHGG